MSAQCPKGDGIEQELTQFAVLILCDDSAFCDEMGNYFATGSRHNNRHCM